MLGLRVAHADSSFVLATWRTILIVIWRGPMEARHFTIIEPIAYELLRDAKDGCGLISVFEAGVFEASRDSREHASRIFEDAGRVLRAAAYVYEGAPDRVAALVARSEDVIARADTPAAVARFTDLTLAADWLVDACKLARHAEEARHLVEAITRLRTQASTPR